MTTTLDVQRLSLEDYRALLAWALSGDTGMSSETMVARMTGMNSTRADRPHDLDDFGRCYRLLQRVPALRPLLPRMTEVSPVWAALVNHWEEIETAYAAYVDVCNARGVWFDQPAWRVAYRPFVAAIHEGDPSAHGLDYYEREWALQDSPEYQAQMAKWREEDARRQRKREELEEDLEAELDDWDEELVNWELGNDEDEDE